MINGADPITITLFVILILIFAVLFGGAIAMNIRAFRRELRHINLEIARTVGKERKYWRREKRRLWLTLLPFCQR